MLYVCSVGCQTVNIKEFVVMRFLCRCRLMDTYKEYLEIHYKTLQRENILMDESENNIIFILLY